MPNIVNYSNIQQAIRSVESDLLILEKLNVIVNPDVDDVKVTINITRNRRRILIKDVDDMSEREKIYSIIAVEKQNEIKKLCKEYNLELTEAEKEVLNGKK